MDDVTERDRAIAERATRLTSETIRRQIEAMAESGDPNISLISVAERNQIIEGNYPEGS
jgi:hypothetical protein